MSKTYHVSSMSREEVRFLSKPIATYNNILIDMNEVKRHVALKSSPLVENRRLGGNLTGLGLLACLPFEILSDVSAILDISSVILIRAISSTMKFKVESWPRFEEAMKNARQPMLSLIATESSRLWTFDDLLSTIYTSTCHFCGRHGEILHLLKLRRVCFRCVTSDRRLLAVLEDYVQYGMGVPEHEFSRLPRLRVTRRQSFWGSPRHASAFVYDYSSALDLAITKQMRPRSTEESVEPRSQLIVSIHSTGSCVLKGMSSYHEKIGKPPIHARRRLPCAIKSLPRYLINPPESNYAQHACCMHFPALKSTPNPSNRAVRREAASHPIPAVLCAGCSFYFNYHTSLPHQSHALFPHPTDSSPTPFTRHLEICPYARLYWQNLYPPHLDYTNPFNPNLDSNGGHYTRAQLHEQQDLRIANLLIHSCVRDFVHFPRHTVDLVGTTRIPARTNDLAFEMLPWNMLRFFWDFQQGARRERERGGKKTFLDVRLERKARGGDARAVALLDDRDDAARFDGWTCDWLALIRRRRREGYHMGLEGADVDGSSSPFSSSSSSSSPTPASQEAEDDRYADVLLEDMETVSQAVGATMRPSSANCLFRGWTGLLMERKSKMAAVAAREGRQGRQTRQQQQEEEEEQRRDVRPAEPGMGLDRFGCVSRLG